MFRVAFLERSGSREQRLEERLVADELRSRGTPFEFYTQKQIDRRTLPLGPDTFIMGAMPAMHGAMKQLHIPIPQPDDYPEPLRPFLHRRIWRSTLKELEQQIWRGLARPVLAKPADRRKSFTGQVFVGEGDLYFLGSTGRRQDIWCAEVVRWIAEYRVYVIHEKVVAIDHYAGAADVPLSQETLANALHAYCASGLAPKAFAVDFGVLESGETALVEANDGYALGAYDVEGGVYTDLLLTRWSELLASREPGGKGP